jgi:hypothetical protein
MKRKLDANDVPSTEVAEASDEKQITFESLNLDPRLLQALVKENFSKPTLVQSQAIPLALDGKDILGIQSWDLILLRTNQLTGSIQLAQKPDLARQRHMCCPSCSPSSEEKLYDLSLACNCGLY